MVVLHPKITETVGSLMKSSIADKIQGASASQLLKAGAAGGAAIGVGKAVYDDIEDDAMSTGGKAIAHAGVGAIAAVGAKEGIKHVSTRLDAAKTKELIKPALSVDAEINRTVAEAVSEKVATQHAKNTKLTSGDIAQEQVKAKHEASDTKQKLTDKEWKDKKTQKMQRWKGNAGLAGMAGLGAFALASVLDTSQGFSDRTEVGRMLEKQEQNLTRKDNKEKEKNREKSYGHVDMGEIAFEMFENRLGHHKMGNAKFE